jgi:hypothetical protein
MVDHTSKEAAWTLKILHVNSDGRQEPHHDFTARRATAPNVVEFRTAAGEALAISTEN